jgi:hypothetical protein
MNQLTRFAVYDKFKSYFSSSIPPKETISVDQLKEEAKLQESKSAI